jgi:hypothetical protein
MMSYKRKNFLILGLLEGTQTRALASITSGVYVDLSNPAQIENYWAK